MTQLPALYDSDQSHLIWIGAAVVVSNLIIPLPDLPVTVLLTIAICFGLVCYGQRNFIRTLREIDAKRNGAAAKGTEASSPYGFAIGPPKKRLGHLERAGSVWSPSFVGRVIAA